MLHSTIVPPGLKIKPNRLSWWFSKGYLHSVDNQEDRLEVIRRKLKGAQVYYSRYSPSSTFRYAVESAEDDMLWLVYEVERLKKLRTRSP